MVEQIGMTNVNKNREKLEDEVPQVDIIEQDNVPDSLKIPEKKEISLPESVNENDFTPEEIERLGKTEIPKKGKEVKKISEEKVKVISADKARIMARVKRVFDIDLPIDVDEDGTIIKMRFKVKRLTPEQRATLTPLKEPKFGQELTKEEIKQNRLQDLEVLSKCILDPPMTIEEWEQIDVAIVDNMISEIMELNMNTNDRKLLDHYSNLSERTMILRPYF